MSKVELPEFSGEPGTHPFNNLPIPQLWDANAWGKKINQQHAEKYRVAQSCAGTHQQHTNWHCQQIKK